MRITKYTLKLNEDLMNSLIKESSFNYPRIKSLNMPEKIVDMMNAIFSLNEMAEEYVYLLCFNTDMRLIGVFELSHGCVDSAIVSTRSIFLRAILCAATCIVLVHNHPSGNEIPSTEDISITKKIKDASRLMDIPLKDHIIISGNRYLSMKQKKLM